ncbi:MAG: thioredoxin domain-containing protein [Flavobacteriales bacterium]|nr:thioredoxin domain-containing protein [Flavobacteriales bacterium]
MKRYIQLIALVLIVAACNSNGTSLGEIQWNHRLSKSIFEQAKSEDKLILLTLEANWCHWCHVMEDSTYSNGEVQELVNENFISVKVDQDANPELAARYRKYGWPATIVLNAEGEDLMKKAGYMSPSKYAEELQKVLRGTPSVKRSMAKNQLRPEEIMKERLKNNFTKYLDDQNGGFKSSMRYLEEESMEYVLHFDNSNIHRNWFQKSIEAAYALCDQEWGGVYQYSARRDWNHPHYEKLLHIQARYMRLFLNDYAFNGNEESLRKAEEIRAYCERFLKQSNGLYGNAQDADLKKGEKASAYFELSDEERIKRGIPAIDTNTYTNSNADFARSLLKFYSITNNQEDLKRYQTILGHLLQRKTAKGLYSHAYNPKEIDALRDNLAMAQLFTEHMKRFPKDRKIAAEMEGLATMLVKYFRLPNGTFQGFSGELGLVPKANVEENVPLARFFNWYAAFSGKEKYKKHATSVANYLRKVDAEKPFFHEPEISMLFAELSEEAGSHVSVKEEKSHPLLVQAYIFAPYFSNFQLLEDSNDATKLEQFSGIETSSLFICTSSYCSSPLRDEEAVKNFYK